MRVVLALVVCVCAAACAAERGCEASGVELTMLTQGKKVIPLVLEYPNLTVTDIRLPDLVLTNGSSQPVMPRGIEVTGTLGGEEIARFRVPADVVKALVEKVHPQLRVQLGTEEMADSMGTAFGLTDLDVGKLCDGLPLKPGQCAVVLLSKVLYFHHVGLTGIDALKIVLGYESEGKNQSVEMPVPLTAWKSQVKYTFPLRGVIAIANMPLNYLHHRQAHSQEFAIDLLEIRPDKDSSIGTSRVASPTKLTDYHVYGRDVLSVADGTVVEVADAFPESSTVNPWSWSDEAFEKVSEHLRGKVPPANILCGNYAVIRHSDSEFSFYAHLKHNSLTVRAGDKVKARQPIAKAGSTGNSTEPHLHFQLMDSADFLTANGLPIMFDDVPAQQMVSYLKSANTLACSDALFVEVE